MCANSSMELTIRRIESNLNAGWPAMPDFRPCGFVCTTPARQSEKGLLLDFQGNQRLFADSKASQQFLREETTHQGTLIM